MHVECTSTIIQYTYWHLHKHWNKISSMIATQHDSLIFFLIKSKDILNCKKAIFTCKYFVSYTITDREMFKSRGQKMCFSTFKCHVLLFRQLGTYLVVDCKLLRVLLLTYIVEFSTKRQQDKIPDNPQLICKQGTVLKTIR